MKDGKGIRIVFLSPALVVGLLIFQHALRPIKAATQNEPSPATASAPKDAGAAAYTQHCAICHGSQREGILPGFPPLLGIHH
ncbi:MAG: c-type cytochrome, partial [Terracidiphilus sp.]